MRSEVGRLLFRITAWLFLALSSASIAKACESDLELQLETGKSQSYCEQKGWLISRECADRKSGCSLVKELETRLPQLAKKNGARAPRENPHPASELCHTLGWKVLIGRHFDGSETCVCERRVNESVVCTSLVESTH